MTIETPPLRRRNPRRTALLALGLSSLLVVAPMPALAETPAPTPPAASATAAPSPPAASEPATPALIPTPAPTATSTAAQPSDRDAAAQQATAAASLSLQVGSLGSPQPGRFFQDLGRFSFTGKAAGLEGSTVEVYRRGPTSAWARVAKSTVVQGAYAVQLPVRAAGVHIFASTTGGAPGSGDEVASPAVQVEVADSRVVLNAPPARVDSLKNPSLTGSVVPARPGVQVQVQVRAGSRFTTHARAVTDAAGRFKVTFSHGRGRLATYSVRSTYRAANRDRWEFSGSRTLSRVGVLNPVVTRTTAAEVEKTYRKGCPVGRSKLSTITMNFYGRDKRMHRGVLIIRTDLVPEVKAAFGKAISARYPLAKMNNPNVYGGNDPRQMAANNTSGFNCRKVVGNPYAQSPHSYGTAIDVNTVQNPYRDARGRWWPANGKSYIDRTPLRLGMLGKSSTLTKQLRSDGFFWGGLWSPGRDYQHFQYQR